jgi:methionyl-tRNA formyltransferase
MVMKEHPYGCEMLSQLLAGGFRPAAILEEDSKLATEEREKFRTRIQGNPLAAPIAEQAAEHDIPVTAVKRHKDPNLIVLGGTRIIRGEILSFPRDGVLNAHPGLLPECRGSASPAWSVYHDIPVGSSCHFCSPEIDEGDVVRRREVEVRRGDTYEDLCYKTLVMAGTLMTEAVRAYHEGRIDELRLPQGESPHPTFKNMPDELLETVYQKLRDQTYAHYVD